MPIVWRYVTTTYLKIFSLCLMTLFGLGFLIRYKKIALLIVAGATYKQALLLSFCMLSVVLPHIIAISSAISAFLTVYKLNSSKELTSLRASGLSFSHIVAPLYFAGAFLMLINFFLVSEWIPYTKLLTGKLRLESQTVNPLILLRKNSLPFLKNFYAEMAINDTGAESDNVLIAYFLENKKRISLLLADSLDYTNHTLQGKNMAWISHIPSDEKTFDHLIIDNQSQTSSPDSVFPSFLERHAKVHKATVFSLFSLAKSPSLKMRAELFQRVSKILYPLSFTILGLSAALFNRNREKNLLFFSLISFFYFIPFFLLKKSGLSLPLILIFTFVPHILILTLSFVRQKIILRGTT